MKKVITYPKTLDYLFKSLDAVRYKKSEEKYKPASYIFYDSEEQNLVSTDGKCMLVIKVIEEELISQFEGKDWFLTLHDHETLVAEDEVMLNDKPMIYPMYKKIIPDVNGLKFDKIEIPIIQNSWGIDKKYIPFTVCEFISRETDNLYNPMYFDFIKSIIQDFAYVFFPHIETYEEEEERIEKEKSMTEAERLQARKRRINYNNMPTLLLTQDETMSYVLCNIKIAND